jgi:hypothetical protein
VLQLPSQSGEARKPERWQARSSVLFHTSPTLPSAEGVPPASKKGVTWRCHQLPCSAGVDSAC